MYRSPSAMLRSRPGRAPLIALEAVELEGETVSVLADGNVETSQVVTDGSISLQRPYSIVHAGLPITGEIETSMSTARTPRSAAAVEDH